MKKEKSSGRGRERIFPRKAFLYPRVVARKLIFYFRDIRAAIAAIDLQCLGPFLQLMGVLFAKTKWKKKNILRNTHLVDIFLVFASFFFSCPASHKLDRRPSYIRVRGRYQVGLASGRMRSSSEETVRSE